jgi:predicted DNA-binding transcriptional regulator YafY
MRSLEPLRERFRRRQASYRDYLEWGRSSGGGDADASAVRLHLRFAPAVRFLVEDYFAEVDRTTLDDGAVEVRATFPRDRWVDSMILAYGDQVEVLEPTWMRDRIADVAGRVRAMYGTPNQT